MELVREQVLDAIERSSLRGVAREVGMSPTGLQKFAGGAAPYRDTRRKLTEWFARRELPPPGEQVTPDAAKAALALLLHGLPARRRSLATQQILVLLRTAYDQSRTPSPAWLREQSSPNE